MATVIEKTVASLVKKYNTRNPFTIARRLNIHVKIDDLADCSGCYIYLKRHKCIFINAALPEHEQLLVMAHELGHAVLHSKVNCYFFRNKTFLNTSRFEHEANAFAAYLLIPDHFIEECSTLGQLSALTGMPEELVKLRLN